MKKDVRAYCIRSIFAALTAVLVLATTITFTACEEKEKKQDGTTATEPAAAAETQQPTQEAVAEETQEPSQEAAAGEDKPKYFECGVSDAAEAKEEAKWSMGQANNDFTRIVSSGKKYTRAVKGGRVYKIKYIGEKKERREERDMEFYFGSYETSCGSDYEIINSKGNEYIGDIFLLYNDSDKWGGVPDNIVFKNFGEERPKVGKDDIAAMEKLQNGRKIILSEVIADFSIEGKPNRLMLARYKNSKKDGLFQIVLRDHNNDYFTADYPSGLDESGQPNWRADMGDEIGSWELYFVGRVAEGLFLVTDWCAAEGCGTTAFVAKDGKLENWNEKEVTQ